MAAWAPHRISPKQPHQVHLSEGEDQWLGDSKKAPQAAGPDGKTDTNVQPLLDGAGCIHKEEPQGTGWRYLQIAPGIRRKLTAKELATPYSRWPKKKFVRLRRTRFPGKSFESRVRPLLFLESVKIHRQYGAIMVADLKGQFTAAMARAMWEAACRARATVWFKTIVFQAAKPPRPPYSMAIAGMKAAPFHAAGAPVALATHGYPPPKDLETWRSQFDAIWGTNAKEYHR